MSANLEVFLFYRLAFSFFLYIFAGGMRMKKIYIIAIMLVGALVAHAQGVLDIIRHNPTFAVTNYATYPDSADHPLTPAPAGKHPFYLSHYGRHGSRYINKRAGYDIPFSMMCRADSLGLLTPIGHEVLSQIRKIMEDSEMRWGDLTSYGHQQIRQIAARMIQRFPEIFEGEAYVNARSTTTNRCILTMASSMLELMKINPKLKIRMEASMYNMWYMNHQDKLLSNTGMTPAAKAAHDAFASSRKGNPQLMSLLFVDPEKAREVVDELQLNYFLIKMGLFQQHTHLYNKGYLRDIFHDEDFHRLWEIDNAWWYINFGFYKLNGGRQPYTQRYLLRQLINDADSCIRMERPGAQLRFGHDTVLLPLVCLIGVNGFDLETDNLEELESKGWWSSSVFPMASNIQFIFYRENQEDQDVLFKVLLNEQEATLPISTDCAPYYHWRDFREHYLKKINDYERLRAEETTDQKQEEPK